MAVPAARCRLLTLAPRSQYTRLYLHIYTYIFTMFESRKSTSISPHFYSRLSRGLPVTSRVTYRDSGELQSSVQAVARVTESGNDEGVVVEFGVYGPDEDVYLRVVAQDALHARDGGHGVEAGYPARPIVL